MNQEIEYAEMLEIPVSTVNVVHKKRRKKAENELLKNTEPTPTPLEIETATIEPVLQTESVQTATAVENTEFGGEAAEQLSATDAQNPDQADDQPQNEGDIVFDPIPEHIDTVRLYAAEDVENFKKNGLQPQDYHLHANSQNGHTMYAMNAKNTPSKPVKIALGIEFGAVCALCAAIFITNAAFPNSAVNSFFRGMLGTDTETAANHRVYSDFELSPIVSTLSKATLTLSENGILTLTDATHVYPAADGTVAEIAKSADGLYTVTVQYSDSFSGVFQGLDQLYYSMGDSVKPRVPLGYSDGEGEVQITMYSDGTPLNCFRITDENCLAWLSENE